MRSGDMALRFSIVLSVIGFVALAAALYETDRREKSSSAARERDLIEFNERLGSLGSQVRGLSAQLNTSERQFGNLSRQVDQNDSRLAAIERQIQIMMGRYDARLKELEDDLRVRRLESPPR
jgi:chromosome segregation ATPase